MGPCPLAIVIFIDCSFIKNKIAAKTIYITVHNLNSAVSGKSLAWGKLGMLPALRKKNHCRTVKCLARPASCIMHA